MGLQHYAMSQDGSEIAFAMQDKTGRTSVWIAPTDRRSSPRAIESADNEDCPYFLPDGDLIFRTAEGGQNFLYRMKPDGTERHKISDTAIFDPHGVSRDGRWILAQTRGPDGNHPYSVSAFPVDGGPAVTVCLSLCWATGIGPEKSLYLGLPNSGDKNTYALALRHTGLPNLPAAGISTADDLNIIKAPVVTAGVVESGGIPSQYAYTRSTIRRNLYRIPLP